MASPAPCAERRCSASSTPRTNPTTVRHVRPVASCWQIEPYRDCSNRIGRARLKSSKRAGRARQRPRRHGRVDKPDMFGVRPFRLNVTESILDDLRQRLERVRWPDAPPQGAAWQFRTDLGYLQELVAYWREAFDWRT